MPISSRHQSTLEAVFTEPPPANIRWADIESLLLAMGADCSEGSGSRLRVAHNGVRAVFHRPHPEKEASKSTVRSVKKFLEQAGVTP